jgi:type 1 glutamine amidotransferase
VLAYVSENSYKGGTVGEKHPLVWSRYLGANNAPIYYCALGHFSHSYNSGNDCVSYFLEDGFNFVSNITRK